MADSFMPLYERRQQVRALRIDRIEKSGPFMWNLIMLVSPNEAIQMAVHAHFVGTHKPQVGGYLVDDLEGSITYVAREQFERHHKPVEAHADIEPLAGQVWQAPFEISGFSMPKGVTITRATAPMEGVNIDAAHHQQ